MGGLGAGSSIAVRARSMDKAIIGRQDEGNYRPEVVGLVAAYRFEFPGKRVAW